MSGPATGTARSSPAMQRSRRRDFSSRSTVARVGCASAHVTRPALRATPTPSSIRSSTSSSSIRPTARSFTSRPIAASCFDRRRVQLDPGNGSSRRRTLAGPRPDFAWRRTHPVCRRHRRRSGAVHGRWAELGDDPQRRQPGGVRQHHGRRIQRIQQGRRRVGTSGFAAQPRGHPGALRHDGRNGRRVRFAGCHRAVSEYEPGWRLDDTSDRRGAGRDRYKLRRLLLPHGRRSRLPW